MIPREERQISRQPRVERFVERDAVRTLARELEEDKRADVNEADLGWVAARLIHQKHDRHEKLGDVAVLKDVRQERGVLLHELPEKHEQLCVALDLIITPTHRRPTRQNS